MRRGRQRLLAHDVVLAGKGHRLAGEEAAEDGRRLAEPRDAH